MTFHCCNLNGNTCGHEHPTIRQAEECAAQLDYADGFPNNEFGRPVIVDETGKVVFDSLGDLPAIRNPKGTTPVTKKRYDKLMAAGTYSVKEIEAHRPLVQ